MQYYWCILRFRLKHKKQLAGREFADAQVRLEAQRELKQVVKS
jgi:hypothetical protein